MASAAGSRTIADALRRCNSRDILDMSCREPVTNSPFGHTAVTKLEIFRRIRQLGMRNVAALAWYDDYSPVEDQFLELLVAEEPLLNGIVVMFPTGDQSALAKLRASSIPNVFIDVYLSPRNQRGAVDASSGPQTHLQQTLQSILEHFKAISGQRQPPPNCGVNLDWKYRYHIYVNLVDLCDAPIGTPATDAVIAYLKHANIPNVTHICFEEFRGDWTHEKYGEVAALLRSHFPRGRYKLLVHAHAGAVANDTGACTLEAVKHGADGIWSAFLPDAAQVGHNASIRFLSDLWRFDHPTVDHFYSFDKMIPLARELHELSFPGVPIDPRCPIYGAHAAAWVNQAFRHQDNSPHAFPAEAFGGFNRSRIAPMISDDTTIAGRVGEVVGTSFTGLPLERQQEVARRIRRCMHAVLADGRRYDFDHPEIVKWIYQHVSLLRADEEVAAPSAQTEPLPAIRDSQPVPATQRVPSVPLASDGDHTDIDTAMAGEQNIEIAPQTNRSSDASAEDGDASATHLASPSSQRRPLAGLQRIGTIELGGNPEENRAAVDRLRDVLTSRGCRRSLTQLVVAMSFCRINSSVLPVLQSVESLHSSCCRADADVVFEARRVESFDLSLFYSDDFPHSPSPLFMMAMQAVARKARQVLYIISQHDLTHPVDSPSQAAIDIAKTLKFDNAHTAFDDQQVCVRNAPGFVLPADTPSPRPAIIEYLQPLPTDTELHIRSPVGGAAGRLLTQKMRRKVSVSFTRSVSPEDRRGVLEGLGEERQVSTVRFAMGGRSSVSLTEGAFDGWRSNSFPSIECIVMDLAVPRELEATAAVELICGGIESVVGAVGGLEELTMFVRGAEAARTAVQRLLPTGTDIGNNFTIGTIWEVPSTIVLAAIRRC
ncbi:unnamed protein product [Vitrella brassicaformis CCMP3155]|uniref:Uncharacterized protein n=2 Tax=Vitrella brassicaformis TaxID=1169539 RepID=A0A0G4GM82_VITBC|nr:unnamed protein product [Vitrella brassicaformis CCMP3155]|eukprot:CEM31294.1 unnamed protein product [Vitrella brassicaformis CCMP3155]